MTRRSGSSRAIAWALRHLEGEMRGFAMGETSMGSDAGWAEVKPVLTMSRSLRGGELGSGDLREALLAFGKAAGRARRARPADASRPTEVTLPPAAAAQAEIARLTQALYQMQEAAKDLRARLDCAERGREAFKLERDEHAAKRAEFASEARSLLVKLEEARRSNDYACETPLAGCDCPGCSLARDESGAPAPKER